jgi:hypothetical protein
MQAQKLTTCLAGVLAAGLWLAAPVSAGEKKLMHCFTFTAIEAATADEWKAFQQATDELPGKIPGLSRVWHGKLRSPQTLFTVDAATRKKLGAGEKDVVGPVNRVTRQYGVCMEMSGLDILKTYASHPAHAEWVKVYEKVRVYGTTTFDIIGQ